MIVPDGYIAGMCRNEKDKAVSHLYRGTFDDPGEPMCARGWNRLGGHGYSIFRGHISEAGLCRVCLRRAKEGRDPMPPRNRPTKWL